MPESISDKISTGNLSDIELLGIIRDDDILSNEMHNSLVQNGFYVENLSSYSIQLYGIGWGGGDWLDKLRRW